jgi:hypothetical protein
MNNEPAFPAMHYDLADNEHGLTMRDYFAAKAMMALIAHPDSDGDKPPSVFAKTAYVMADAMLKAREI